MDLLTASPYCQLSPFSRIYSFIVVFKILDIRSWLGHYATNRKVAGSRPDEVNELFSIYIILSAALGHGIYSASIINEYQKQKKKCLWGVDRGRWVKLTTLPLSVSWLSRQCESFDNSQPYRPPRPVAGIALLFNFFIIGLQVSGSEPKLSTFEKIFSMSLLSSFLSLYFPHSFPVPCYFLFSFLYALIPSHPSSPIITFILLCVSYCWRSTDNEQWDLEVPEESCGTASEAHITAEPTGKRWKTELGRERFLAHGCYDNRVLFNVKSWLGRLLTFLASIWPVKEPKQRIILTVNTNCWYFLKITVDDNVRNEQLIEVECTNILRLKGYNIRYITYTGLGKRRETRSRSAAVNCYWPSTAYCFLFRIHMGIHHQIFFFDLRFSL
jgi:hypothetical protein